MVRNRASRLGISRLVRQQNKIVAAFEKRSAFGPESISALMDVYGPRLTIYGGVEPRLSVVLGKGETALAASKKLLQSFADPGEKA